jgi:hypothetical protein
MSAGALHDQTSNQAKPTSATAKAKTAAMGFAAGRGIALRRVDIHTLTFRPLLLQASVPRPLIPAAAQDADFAILQADFPASL